MMKIEEGDRKNKWRKILTMGLALFLLGAPAKVDAGQPQPPPQPGCFHCPKGILNAPCIGMTQICGPWILDENGCLYRKPCWNVYTVRVGFEDVPTQCCLLPDQPPDFWLFQPNPVAPLKCFCPNVPPQLLCIPGTFKPLGGIAGGVIACNNQCVNEIITCATVGLPSCVPLLPGMICQPIVVNVPGIPVPIPLQCAFPTACTLLGLQDCLVAGQPCGQGGVCGNVIPGGPGLLCCIPPMCGDGKADPGEKCGEPGLAPCVAGQQCIGCLCKGICNKVGDPCCKKDGTFSNTDACNQAACRWEGNRCMRPSCIDACPKNVMGGPAFQLSGRKVACNPRFCPPLPVCGNGVREEGEDCDDGNNKDDASGGKWNEDCLDEEICKNCDCEKRCGNGTVDSGEECDPGIAADKGAQCAGVGAGMVGGVATAFTCNADCRCEESPTVSCTPEVTAQCDSDTGSCGIKLCCQSEGEGAEGKKVMFTFEANLALVEQVPGPVEVDPAGSCPVVGIQCKPGVEGPVSVSIKTDTGYQTTVSVSCKLAKCTDLGPGWKESECVSGECQETAQVVSSGQSQTCYKCSDPAPPSDNCGCTEGVAAVSVNDTEHCGGGCVKTASQKTCEFVCPSSASPKGKLPTQTVYCCKYKLGHSFEPCVTSSCSTVVGQTDSGINCIDKDKVDCDSGKMGKPEVCYCGTRESSGVKVCPAEITVSV